ncbi:MAG: cytochrome b [Betaproteobacteria bacterium]
MFSSEPRNGDDPAFTVRYTSTAIVLHWLIAFVVISQIVLGWLMQEIPKVPVGPRVNAYNLHKSIGLTVLMLMALRLAWRATHAPPPPVAMPAWQVRAAWVSHWLLYACLFVQPLSGYLGSAFSGYPVRYFGLVLPAWAATSPTLKQVFENVHLVTSVVLVAAIALHVAAAFKHHLIDRDGLLYRMRWRRAR